VFQWKTYHNSPASMAITVARAPLRRAGKPVEIGQDVRLVSDGRTACQVMQGQIHLHQRIARVVECG
jgi:hypothetical protein